MDTNTTYDITSKNMTQTIEEIIKNRKHWEEGTYAASNTELYAVLASCLALYQACIQNHALSEGLKTALKNKNLKSNSKTSLAVKVIRLIFATEENQAIIKNRVFSYAKALEVAHEQKQTQQSFAQFVTEKGGLDELRRSSDTPSKKQREDKIAIAKIRYVKNKEALVSGFSIPKQLQPKAGSRFSVALVVKNADGTGSIVFGSVTDSIVNNLLEEAGGAISKAAQDNALAEVARSVEEQSAENLAALQEQMASQEDHAIA